MLVILSQSEKISLFIRRGYLQHHSHVDAHRNKTRNCIFVFVRFICRTSTLMDSVAFSMHFWTAKRPKSYHAICFFHFSSHRSHSHKFKRKFSIKWQRSAVMRHAHQSRRTQKVRFNCATIASNQL